MLPNPFSPEYPYDIGYEAAWFCRHVSHDAACLEALRKSDPAREVTDRESTRKMPHPLAA